MNQRPGMRLVLFAVSAVATMVVASAVVAGAAHDRRGGRSPRAARSKHLARAAGGSSPRPTPPRPVVPVSSGRATTIAARFAAAWRAWDAGRRSPQDAATLRRLSQVGLWQTLRHQRAGPTAARPPTSLALHTVQAVATGNGTWRATLVARPDNSYLGSLVIVATPAGPRVAEIQR